MTVKILKRHVRLGTFAPCPTLATAMVAGFDRTRKEGVTSRPATSWSAALYTKQPELN